MKPVIGYLLLLLVFSFIGLAIATYTGVLLAIGIISVSIILTGIVIFALNLIED